MSKNKWYMVLLISLILSVIIYVSDGMLNVGKKEPYYSVSVVLDDSGSERWSAFREGMEQAAASNNIHLNVVSTGKLLNLREECSVISRELENGADGMILELCGDDTEKLFSEIGDTGTMVLVENDIRSENLFSVVAPDQYELGKVVAKAVAEGEQEGLAELKIGILSGNQEKESQRQRLKGVQDFLEGEGAKDMWVLSEREISSRKRGELEPVDVLITLENSETERAVDFLLETTENTFRLYGEGRSEKAVYYLDKGIIEALIVPNEFYMGYQSVMILAQKLKFFTSGAENETVDFLTVTDENLYDRDVEKILFPTIR